MGRVLLGDLLGQAFRESLAAQEPAVPSLGPRGGGRGGQAGGDETPVRCLRIGPPELPDPGRKKCLESYPVDTVAAAEISGRPNGTLLLLVEESGIWTRNRWPPRSSSQPP